MDIARELPHVLFTGIDIGAHLSHCPVTSIRLTIFFPVPIATRYPLPNVRFEIGDITEELRWPNAIFDFIHARSISLSVSHDFCSEIVSTHEFFDTISPWDRNRSASTSLFCLK
jgi:hypothetical protein